MLTIKFFQLYYVFENNHNKMLGEIEWIKFFISHLVFFLSQSLVKKVAA